MKTDDFGTKLQLLRKEKKMTQKDFATFLDLPQPTLSAYENGKNSPSMDVLIQIAKKCNTSLDWLCGLSTSRNTIASLGDIADFFYAINELQDIGGEIEIHDHLFNDMETETEKWYTRITFYGRDRRFKLNPDICNILRTVKENVEDLDTYQISKENYELSKEKTVDYYSSLPIIKKDIPDLSREERLKKHREYLESTVVNR